MFKCNTIWGLGLDYLKKIFLTTDKTPFHTFIKVQILYFNFKNS